MNSQCIVTISSLLRRRNPRLQYHDRIFVIDFPQAVDLSSRPNRHRQFEKARPPLRRDLENVARYFSQYDIEIDALSEYDRLTTRRAHLD
ncbi:hypothetical protein E6H32_04780 [Candidatus Bathyarchaeota archaeon]|nr:MAG: hypothetical protein E6H32_04780 [Candidatus Bathyarchaeota archaeon]